MKKIRKRCAHCGARKYVKYLWKHFYFGEKKVVFYTCKNEDLCVAKMALKLK